RGPEPAPRAAAPPPPPQPVVVSPAPGAPGAPAAPGDPLAAWEGVIAGLEEARELSLVSIYQHARILGWTDAAIEVGFPPGMAGEMASEPDKVAAMRVFLGQRFGRQVGFAVKVIDQPGDAPAARSIIEAEADRRREESSRRQDEAREHPLTKVVLDTFGASIKEIKTDV
ncbi:MAG TPA: hypothetical protein VFU21_27250, partial [Kofleriaceae bacterium]|nr:hypothetical protein [Kofleriaceae bacterium]